MNDELTAGMERLCASAERVFPQSFAAAVFSDFTEENESLGETLYRTEIVAAGAAEIAASAREISEMFELEALRHPHVLSEEASV